MTHPFHPLYSQTFELVDCKQAWGEWRVFYYDATGQLRRLPISWTDAGRDDPYLTLAQGRSHFRVDDLLQLVAWVAERSGGCM